MTHIKGLLACLIICVWIQPAAAIMTGDAGSASALGKSLILGDGVIGLVGEVFLDNQVKGYDTGETRGDTTLLYYGVTGGISLAGRGKAYLLVGYGHTKKRFTHDYKETFYDPADVAEENSIDWRAEVNAEYETDEDLVYGLGFCVTMVEHTFDQGDRLYLGMDLKYVFTDFSVDQTAHNGTTYAWDVDEIQGALTLSYQRGGLTPFVGIRISHAHGTERHTIVNTDPIGKVEKPIIAYDEVVRVKKDIGFVAGFAYYLNQFLTAGIETRFGDEEGLAVWAAVRF